MNALRYERPAVQPPVDDPAPVLRVLPSRLTRRRDSASRRGGAGPSDHKAVTVDGRTIMVPVHTSTAWHSPLPGARCARRRPGDARQHPDRDISFPKQPRFYAMQTFDGVPYSHIATLHGSDVLATTVLQTCIRYESRRKTCKFCAIGQSLAAGRTVAHQDA